MSWATVRTDNKSIVAYSNGGFHRMRRKTKLTSPTLYLFPLRFIPLIFLLLPSSTYLYPSSSSFSSIRLSLPPLFLLFILFFFVFTFSLLFSSYPLSLIPTFSLRHFIPLIFLLHTVFLLFLLLFIVVNFPPPSSPSSSSSSFSSPHIFPLPSFPYSYSSSWSVYSPRFSPPPHLPLISTILGLHLIFLIFLLLCSSPSPF